jgi:Reverse transcriptase (RNA-dependent DNA polymerase)
MAITAAFDLEIQQYDAVNASVNGKLNEDIYGYPPEGFERQGSCWHLLRALYGLKQSPLLWYPDFTAALEELGLHPMPGRQLPVRERLPSPFLLHRRHSDSIQQGYNKGTLFELLDLTYLEAMNE